MSVVSKVLVELCKGNTAEAISTIVSERENHRKIDDNSLVVFFEIACLRGNYEFVDFILKEIVVPQTALDKGFVMACGEGNIDIIRLILSSGPNDLADGINAAKEHGKTKVVEMLEEMRNTALKVETAERRLHYLSLITQLSEAQQSVNKITDKIKNSFFEDPDNHCISWSMEKAKEQMDRSFAESKEPL